jgi:hypothetical protein
MTENVHFNELVIERLCDEQHSRCLVDFLNVWGPGMQSLCRSNAGMLPQIRVSEDHNASWKLILPVMFAMSSQ